MPEAKTEMAARGAPDRELRALFDGMPQLAWAATPSGALYYVNRRFTEYVGAPPGSEHTLGFEPFLEPSSAATTLASWNAALARGEPFEMAMTLRRHDGARRWFVTRATPLPEADGSIARWVGTSTDVHEERETRGRLEELASLALDLAGARTTADVAEVIVARGTAAARADTCTLYAFEPAVGLVLIGERGVAPEIVAQIRTLSAEVGESRVFETMRAGISLWAESEEDYLAIYPALASRDAKGPRAKAFWSVPLVAFGESVGLLGMGFYEPRSFSPDERAFVEAFTHQCAQALLRAASGEREELARKRRELLGDAAAALVRANDPKKMLATVADLAVPRLADWCTIELLDPGGGAPRLVAIAHESPEKIAHAKRIAAEHPRDPNVETAPARVIRTGHAELHRDVTGPLLPRGAPSTGSLAELRALGVASAVIVPLRGRTRTLGAMTFLNAESGRHYDDDDLAFAEEFAARAALAIENAQSYLDVEEARAREHALRSEAEAASRAKDEFLATVSHELRTPLNVILGWTVMLRGRKPPSDFEKPLAVIERNARAQARLVEDVLDVSRVISGKLSLRLAPMNIADAAYGAIEAVSPAAEAKKVMVDARIDRAALDIYADADRIQQIIWNLVSNAVKFTPPSGRVTLDAGRDGDDVFLRVADTGEGIPSAALAFVFEPFRQADASTTRRYGGLGLGLAIVKQLVVAHGGTVSVASEGQGKGATFVVRLPARDARSSDLARSGARTPPPSMRKIAQDEARLDGLKVLVVDDEEDARTLVDQILRDGGAEVLLAGSAREALPLLEAARPDVVLSDIGMPEADGYALVRTIRALPRNRGGRTIAIALTAYASSDDARRAVAAGYQAHIAKPVDPSALVAKIAEISQSHIEPRTTPTMKRAALSSDVPASLVAANESFHENYAVARDDAERRAPVLVLLGDTLLLFHDGARRSFEVTPPLYHVIKTVAHVAVATYAVHLRVVAGDFRSAVRERLTGLDAKIEAARRSLGVGEPEVTRDLDQALGGCKAFVVATIQRGRCTEGELAAFAEAMGSRLLRLTDHATRIELAALDHAADRALSEVPPALRDSVEVVVAGDHQARDRSLAMQYFARRFGEKEGEEKRVAYGERVTSEKEALALVGTRRLDRRIAGAFFGDSKRLQRDVLGDAAAAQLDALAIDRAAPKR